ncbi:hypothetical protein Ddye_024694 [Dipteronia dyeriana]|uniref:Uncharacterized protein n=1 Tax=Dipteronia dyeriana TaxID=168575 RepID=A0AAD9WTV3_9ROSI|nr:hypothetical protein Ddye_024694 [Dipteronia dyeriana]
MAVTTVDGDDDHHLHLNSLPLIDVRLLSNSELLSLSLCSSSSSSSTTTNIQFDDEDQHSTPKIDASVFNESAGSRKQTFSRLRLRPRNSSPLPPQIPSPAPVKPLDEENSQVISLLKSLLNIQSHSSAAIADEEDNNNDSQLIPVRVKFEEYSNASGNGIHIGPQNIPVELVTCSETKKKRGRPRKENSGSTIASDYRWSIATENGETDKTVAPVLNGSWQNTPIGIVGSYETGKRKRGRPRKNDSPVIKVNENQNGINNNVSTVGGVSCETGKQKRGRPKKNASGIVKGNEINKIDRVWEGESSRNISNDVVACETSKRKRGRPRKDESLRGYGGVKIDNKLVQSSEGEAPMVENVVREEREDGKEMAVESRNGVVVDVVPLVANVEDPFWEELRRTERTEKGDDLLEFWRGSNGEW